jgi:hypothetical protein
MRTRPSAWILSLGVVAEMECSGTVTEKIRDFIIRQILETYADEYMLTEGIADISKEKPFLLDVISKKH